MTIPILSLFGVNPSGSQTIELLLFLTAVLFITDNIARQNVFPSESLNQLYTESCKGFPEDYCYGLIDKPSDALRLTEIQPKFSMQLTAAFSRGALFDIEHSSLILFINIISFLVAMFSFSGWTTSSDNNREVDLSVSLVAIIFLTIHVIFSMCVYFAQVNMRYHTLFVLNFIWALASYCFCFFYIGSHGSVTSSSLRFYFFLQFLTFIVICHKNFVGKTFIGFKYPDFKLNAHSIIFWNKLVRFVPFLFEFQSILFWMGKETFVPLKDYFIIRDIQTQLEIQLSEKAIEANKAEKRAQKKTMKEEKDERRICGVLILIVIILVIFIPLFFMINPTEDDTHNDLLTSDLEIGFKGFPPFYHATGSIFPISTDDLQEIADYAKEEIDSNGQDSPLYPIVMSPIDTLYCVYFPYQSYFNLVLSLRAFNKLTKDEDNTLIPYYKLTNTFTYPSGLSNTYSQQIYASFKELNTTEKDNGALDHFKVPLAVLQPARDNPRPIDLFYNITLDSTYSDNDLFETKADVDQLYSLSFSVDSLDTDVEVSFLLNDTNIFKILVLSHKISLTDQSVTPSTNLIGIYFLILITFGFIVRLRSAMNYNSLWLTKMSNPNKIYSLILGIETYRTTGDIEREKQTCDQFINTIRSIEQCLRLMK